MQKITFNYLFEKFFVLFTTLLFTNTLNAKPVNETKAKVVGINFLNSTQVNSSNKKSSDNLSILFTETLDGIIPAHYIFTGESIKGFVIVSADDAISPILGYSNEGKMDVSNFPENFKSWMEGYKKQILYLRENHISASGEINSEWTAMYNNKFSSNKTSTTSVSPLLTTQWGQYDFYNDLCPHTYPGYSTRCPTGCVATAMAQVMKYWNFPEHGTGFNIYTSSNYGTLSANFESATYNWSAMPNLIHSPNIAVATLMYHCGISVDMEYDPAGSSASGTFGTPIDFALKKHFSYAKSAKKIDIYFPFYIDTLKKELDSGRPMIFGGKLSNGMGHALVYDGYDGNDFFHLNYGWDGQFDGFYAMGNANGFNLTEIYLGIQPSKMPTSIIESSDINSLLIYPNPSTGKFAIELDNQISEIKVFDVLGNELVDQKPNAFKTDVDLSNQAKGIYLVKIYDQTRHVVNRRIIIQ